MEKYDPVQQRVVKIFNREKYLPVFTHNLFSALGIKDAESDYKYFYPNSNWYEDNDRLYPANAGVLEASIPTDNGYLYIVDQVIEPLRTIYNILEDPSLKYTVMNKLYDKFPAFRYDKDLSAKYADAGDSLFYFYHMSTANFALLDVGSEWTSDREDWTLLTRDGFNAFVPNDGAMTQFFRQYWGAADISESEKYKDYEDLDRLAMFYLVSNHFVRSQGIMFPELIRQGLKNSWGSDYTFDVDADVEHKEICGNGVFYGINKVEVPTIFQAVTRPLFQSRKYRIFSYMLMQSGMLPVLANQDRKITMLIPSDATLSTLYYIDEGDGSNLSNFKVKQRSDNKVVGTAALEAIIRYHTISEVIEPEDIQGEGKWYESDKQAAFLKVGGSAIVQENGKPVNMGVDEFNTDGAWGANWRAYEVNELFATPENMMDAMEPGHQHNEWYDWIKLHWKNEIMRTGYTANTDYWTGSGLLVPFKDSRGILFCTHDSWGRPGKNGVPVGNPNNKKEMNTWVGKHMIARKQNEHLNVLDFLQGTVQRTDFATITPGFSIRILETLPVADDDPNKQFGAFVMTILLPDSEGGRTVHAYGPNIAQECLFYVLPTEDERFVLGKTE